MAALACDWLRYFWLFLWNSWTEFNETWQEARSQYPLASLCFSGRSEKRDSRHGLWLAETFSTSLFIRLNGFQRKLTGSKNSTSFPNLCYSGRWENKMAVLASDWLRHFRLLLLNGWTEFNEIWQEARSQRPLASLFSGRSEKQDDCLCLWLAETFSISPFKRLNGIQRKLTGSKISNVFSKFVLFRPIGKARWPPWPLIDWDFFNFSSERAEHNSTKLHRKQDLNILHQVCILRADPKNKMASLAILKNVGTLYSGARYMALWAFCYIKEYHYNNIFL